MRKKIDIVDKALTIFIPILLTIFIASGGIGMALSGQLPQNRSSESTITDLTPEARRVEIKDQKKTDNEEEESTEKEESTEEESAVVLSGNLTMPKAVWDAERQYSIEENPTGALFMYQGTAFFINQTGKDGYGYDVSFLIPSTPLYYTVHYPTWDRDTALRYAVFLSTILSETGASFEPDEAETSASSFSPVFSGVMSSPEREKERERMTKGETNGESEGEDNKGENREEEENSVDETAQGEVSQDLRQFEKVKGGIEEYVFNGSTYAIGNAENFVVLTLYPNWNYLSSSTYEQADINRTGDEYYEPIKISYFEGKTTIEERFNAALDQYNQAMPGWVKDSEVEWDEVNGRPVAYMSMAWYDASIDRYTWHIIALMEVEDARSPFYLVADIQTKRGIRYAASILPFLFCEVKAAE